MADTDAGSNAEVALRSLSEIERRVSSQGAADHALISICTVLEVFVDSTLLSLIEASGISSSRFGRALLGHLEDQLNQSWTSRLRWLSNGFNVSLAGTEIDGDRGTLVEARNALIHGGGKLTGRQVRNPADALDLQRRLRDRMGAIVVGHSLDIGKPALDWSFEVARRYIRALDATVSRLPASQSN